MTIIQVLKRLYQVRIFHAPYLMKNNVENCSKKKKKKKERVNHDL